MSPIKLTLNDYLKNSVELFLFAQIATPGYKYSTCNNIFTNHGSIHLRGTHFKRTSRDHPIWPTSAFCFDDVSETWRQTAVTWCTCFWARWQFSGQQRHLSFINNNLPYTDFIIGHNMNFALTLAMEFERTCSCAVLWETFRKICIICQGV